MKLMSYISFSKIHSTLRHKSV